MFALPGIELPMDVFLEKEGKRRLGNNSRSAQIGGTLKATHTRGSRCGADISQGRCDSANPQNVAQLETSMSASIRNSSRARLPKVASQVSVAKFRDSLKEQLPKLPSRPTSAASSSRMGTLSTVSTRASSRASSRPTSAIRSKSATCLPPVNRQSQDVGTNLCKTDLVCPPHPYEASSATPEPCELALSIRPRSNRHQQPDMVDPAFAANSVDSSGSPCRSAGLSLSKEYEKLTSGCCGPAAAAWMERSLQLGKTPSLEEIHACHAFCRYDLDGDGKLNFTEFGRLLQDQGLPVNLKQAIQALELVAGSGAQGLHLEGFLELIAHATEARHGYSESEYHVLRNVFDAYDANSSGFLEAQEYSALFADLGLGPSTKHESESLGSLIASCRKDSKLGPVDFIEFLLLARKIDGGCTPHKHRSRLSSP
eukprot:TRINITY_DN4298_c1_g5_i1.p1 TRINITY_DN4298_c1_g5~~TRINITY_DN4298_c1_g5_i1.p1  ORF type:complete len:426 (-),score=62.64 TRINITY_DN4298_c1_g5_i1:137-1414(-)